MECRVCNELKVMQIKDATVFYQNYWIMSTIEFPLKQILNRLKPITRITFAGGVYSVPENIRKRIERAMST